jgi:DNA-binding winged helix-turn-helix (wHTH) protein
MRRFGAFVFDTDTRQLSCDGSDIHLTPKAFDLLGLLLDAAPRVVPKTELHKRLWPKTFVSDATLVGLIKELRRALDDRDREAPIIGPCRASVTRSANPHHVAADRRRVGWILVGGRRMPA